MANTGRTYLYTALLIGGSARAINGKLPLHNPFAVRKIDQPVGTVSTGASDGAFGDCS